MVLVRLAVDEAGRQRRADRTRERADGLKVLVFSGFLSVLDLVGREVPGVLGRIDGSVAPRARQQLVEDFSEHPGHAVLVSQVEAGGVGINIQEAWSCSPSGSGSPAPWCRRLPAHRMGQTRPVQVHRLLAKDTVDERVREIQEGKRLLFDAYARRSDAKDADRASVDVGQQCPPALDHNSVSGEGRVVLAERHRLSLESTVPRTAE